MQDLISRERRMTGVAKATGTKEEKVNYWYVVALVALFILNAFGN